MNFFTEKKLIFALLSAVMFLVIASESVYGIVGNLLGLEQHNDPNSNDRTVLLFVHGLVYFLGTLVLVNFYKMS